VTLFIAICGAIVAAIAGLALALPCKGCELRRERLRQTYEAWKKTRNRE
jgi:gas vesicle protein